MNVAPFSSVPVIVKGYEALSLKPAPIKVLVSLTLLPGSNGCKAVTSNVNVNDPGAVGGPTPPSPRVAVNETIGVVDTFFRMISTVGPPGLNGASGPSTETISIGCSFVVVGVGVGVDVGD